MLCDIDRIQYKLDNWKEEREMFVCKTCKKRYPDQMRTCPICGRPLSYIPDAATNSTAAKNQARKSPRKRCPRCGQVLPRAAKVCIRCKYRYTLERKTFMRYGAAIIAVAAIAFVCVLLLSKKDKESMITPISVVEVVQPVQTSNTEEEIQQGQTSSVKSESNIGDEPTSSSVFEEENANSLEQLLYTISPDIEMNAIESQAKELGLYVNSRFNGIGGKEYRIAVSKDVANMYQPAKGSFITITFDMLHNDSLQSVKFFNEDKMVSAFWTANDGYTMIDYNDPAKYSGRVSIESFTFLMGYQPSVVTDDNLLEILFISVSHQMTKDAVMRYVEENGLSYNSRGAGNEEIIAFDRKVSDKYGDNGSYLVIGFTSSGYVSRLEYYDYVSNYRSGCHAAFFSQEYPYNDYDGFCIMKSRGIVTPVADARVAIDAVKTLRYAE